LYGGIKYFFVLSMERALYHPSGTQNFEMAPTLLENMCTLDVFCVLVTENIHILLHFPIYTDAE